MPHIRNVRTVTDTESLLTADQHIRPQFDRAALLTIDMQADFVTGPYAVPGPEQVVPAVSALVRAFRAANRPIIHIVRLYLPDGSNADICRRSLVASGARVAAPGSSGSGLTEGLVSAGRTALDYLNAANCGRPIVEPKDPQSMTVGYSRCNALDADDYQKSKRLLIDAGVRATRAYVPKRQTR